MYDITKASTFENVKKWITALKANAGENIVMMLIGNKLDLVTGNPSERKVRTSQAQAFAKENNMLFDETSAVSNVKVKEAFETLMEEIYNEQSKVTPNEEVTGVSLSPEEPNILNRTTCCR